MADAAKFRLTFILVLLLFVSATGCSNIQSDRESLNKFASAYVAFRKALTDAEVMSWVIVLDQSERTDGSKVTAYRNFFAGALDVTASNEVRAGSARQAIKYQDSDSKMSEFDRRNDVLDSASLALVQAANAIRNENHRRQAVAIAESARNIEHRFSALRKDYVDTYDMQMVVVTAIAKARGDLNRAITAIREAVPEKKRLGSELDNLREEEQAELQRLQERYAAFKGTTGVTLDYVEPTSGDGSSTQ